MLAVLIAVAVIALMLGGFVVVVRDPPLRSRDEARPTRERDIP